MRAKFPNWRVVDPRIDDRRIRSSPFCHPSPSPSTNDDDDDGHPHAQDDASSMAVGAQWSIPAYRDSLRLYDKIMGMTDDDTSPLSNLGRGGGEPKEGQGGRPSQQWPGMPCTTSCRSTDFTVRTAPSGATTAARTRASPFI
jgi:hypothetical protein